MLRLITLIICVISFQACHSQNNENKKQNGTSISIVDSLDIKKLKEIKRLTDIDSFKTKNFGDKIVAIGEQFLGVPYVGATLEKEEERLVINLRELDCTTFLETTLALGRNAEQLTLNNFAKSLQEMRYFNGKIDGYTSRIHYFGQWIVENEKLGLIDNISEELNGERLKLDVNFMSTHIDSYPALKADKTLVADIIESEKKLNADTLHFIPENKLKSVENNVKNGDLIAITTSIKGLDISHVGIAVKRNSRLHLMHASSKSKKVVVSDIPLSEMLLKNRLQTGVIVIRVKE